MESEERNERYYELKDKWLKGVISPEEQQEFLLWFKDEEEINIEIPSQFAASREILQKRIHKHISEKIKEKTRIVWLRRPIVKLAAASILILLVTSAILYLNHRSPGETLVSAKESKKTTKPITNPPGDKSVLTLYDGSTIVLDSTVNGILAEGEDAKVVQLNRNQLVFHAVKDQRNSVISFNTLSVPRGEQFEIILEDGTKVWLNSASSLRFPSIFKGEDRTVELKGEGYFEVAKNASMPFKVKTQGMEVEVLGTHFNVNAYEDESTVNTTLLEGLVKVTKGNENKKLLPGQQVVMNNMGQLNVNSHVNIDEIMAWKNGEFRFENSKLSRIMRQISRWYDVSIEYQGNVTDVDLSGIISRKKDVSQLLEILEATHKIQFHIIEDKIIVMPYGKNN